MLDAAGQLTAVVVDECYLTLTTSAYREKMQRVHKLRGLRYQYIYLTATLPVTATAPLKERLLLRDLVVVRGRTARADIQYQVH
jgi:superfamily II DNA helicase RecQ